MSSFKQLAATANTPQVVTLVIDDSSSMSGAKAEQMTQAVQDLVTLLQSQNQGTSRFRFLLVIVVFGSSARTMVDGRAPNEISIEEIDFHGKAGGTKMAEALEVAAGSIKRAIERCRGLEGFQEAKAPPPLVLFFSDGANTGGPLDSAIEKVKSIAIASGSLQIVSIGIGMSSADFPLMQKIATTPNLAVNLDPDHLTSFVADAGVTLLQPNADVAEAVKDNAFTVHAE